MSPNPHVFVSWLLSCGGASNTLRNGGTVAGSLRHSLRSTPNRDKLRAKFLEAALSYQGIPYSKRYHKDPSCEFLHSIDGPSRRPLSFSESREAAVIIVCTH